MEDSPFSIIPAELRIRIFEHVLIRNDPICLAYLDDYKRQQQEVRSSTAGLPAALLSVCRAFHVEGAPIFYSSNRFLIKLDRARQETLDILKRWRNSIGSKNFDMIRDVEWQLICVTVESDETPPSVFDDISAIAALRCLSLQAASISGLCLTRIKLRLASFPEAGTSDVSIEPSIDVVIDARKVQPSLIIELEKIVSKMRAAKGHNEYLQMLLARYHVGRLIGLLD